MDGFACRATTDPSILLIRALHLAIPILRRLLDHIDLFRRQVEQRIDPRIERRFQAHDLVQLDCSINLHEEI